MTRITWVKSHQRRLPEHPDQFARVHQELSEAYQRDQHRKFEAELEADIERELDREFVVEMV